MINPTTAACTPRSLPGVLASAIATIRWPLDAATHPPLQLKALPDLVPAGRSGCCRLDPTHPLAAPQLPATLQELFPEEDVDDDAAANDQRAFGVISTALILLGHGLADEAHSLVTPYSWPSEIHFNHGRVRYAETGPAARAFASHAHSLVHRHEAFHVGEFGMQGWQNANYWSNAAAAAGQGGGRDELPHADLFRCVSQVVKEYQDTCPGAKAWALEHQIRPDSTHYFESRAVHELCAQAMRQSEEKKTDDDQFRSFAERVAETELRVLLAHSLQRAGFGDWNVDTVVANRA